MRELLRESFAFFKTAITVALKATEVSILTYWQSLLILLKWTGIVAATLTVLLICGLLISLNSAWIIPTYLILLSLLLGIVLLAASPVLALADFVSDRVARIKKVVRIIAGIIFWLLILALYFYLIPNPSSIPLVLLLSLILALGWYRFGIGLNPRLTILGIWVLLVVVTLVFFFPHSVEILRSKMSDQRVAELIEGKQPVKALIIKSYPTGANVYFNWNHQGQTPLKIESQNIKGILVAVKEGFAADYKNIEIFHDDSVVFDLHQIQLNRSLKVLLMITDDSRIDDGSNSIRMALLESGLQAVGIREETEVREQIESAGGISNPALLAWMRTRFGIGFILFYNLSNHTTELSKQDVGYPGLQDALKGMYRTEVAMGVEILDARTGNTILSFAEKGEDVSVDKSKTMRELTRKLSAKSAERVKSAIL
jgi:hypothetical protein